MIRKVAILGFGSIGQKHSNILARLLGKNNVYVFSSQKDIPFNRLKSFNEIYKLDPDYIVVASDTSHHFNQLKKIDSNLSNKIILVEKPIFDGEKDIKLKNNTYLIGYNLRQHPYIDLLKHELKNEKIYTVNINCFTYLPKWRKNIFYEKSSSASKKRGGGVLLDLSHEIDYLIYLFGDVYHCYSQNLKLSNLKINTDDYLFLYGKIKKGGFFSINLNYFGKIPLRQLFIETKNRTIFLDLINSKMVFNYINKKPKIFKKKFIIDNTYVYQHKAIIAQDYKKICTLKEGLKTMDLIQQIKNFSTNE